MDGFSLQDFAQEGQPDLTDEATYQALLTEGEEPEAVDEDQMLIDQLIMQQTQRMQMTLAYQKQAEAQNRQARALHERIYRVG